MLAALWEAIDELEEPSQRTSARKAIDRSGSANLPI
jgi:hypothetical protein